MTDGRGLGNDDSLDFERLGAASPGGIPSPSLNHVRFVAARSGAPIPGIKPAPAWLGKRVGQYRLLALLGKGAMGKVFRAEDTVLQRQVALKVMPATLARGGKTHSLEQIVHEARAAAAIEHPNVIRIYEVNQSRGIYYIAMELVEGGNLHELVKGGGRFDAARACTLLAEAAEALHAAHQFGVVHRDVKPANLFLDRKGCCKVGDFGLAKVLDADPLTRTGGDSAGTPQFLAPEVIRGMPASAASDVYGLACTAWYLLAGRPPYIGMTKRETLTMHLEQPVPDLAELRPDLPEALSAAIGRALAKDPAERFASAERFAKVLRVHTIPVASAPRLPPAPVMIELPAPAAAAAPRFGRSARIGAAVGGVGLFLVAAVVAWNAGSRAPLPEPSTAAASPELLEDDAAVEAAHAGGPQAAAAATVPAEDVDKLIAIAADKDPALSGKVIAVEGHATWADLSPSGKTFRVGFAGSGAGRGFCLAYPARLFDAMRDRFGGRHGEGLNGQHLRVTGQLSLHKGQPEIKIDSPTQVESIQD